MLVLTRKPTEQIIIKDDIVITIVSISGDRVRVGIEAPRDMSILRAELVGMQQKHPQQVPTKYNEKS